MTGYSKKDKIAIRRKPDKQPPLDVRGSLNFKKGDTQRFQLIALLPVFNGATWLPVTLKNLASNVDAIIALDDGSTDKTLDLLRSCPKVIEIIVKTGKKLVEWNDAQNRLELYLAAAKYEPSWVIAMDADEYFDDHFQWIKNDIDNIPNTIRALAFHFDDVDNGVVIREKFRHKMFRYRTGYTFDNKRLHCRILPLEIAIDEVKLANVRIFHIADHETRQARFGKYLEADPNLKYQSSYRHLLKPAFNKDIKPLGETLSYAPVVEDGLQRKLKVRRIKQFEKLFNTSQLDEVLPMVVSADLHVGLAFELFNKIILDAFLVRFEKKEGLVAQYSYDSTKDTRISKLEGWLIEELHHHRDFDLIVAKLHLIKKSTLITDTADILTQLICNLAKKGVLRIR
ncbi:glycosyltransferase family 2 protein [Mucilaginibacter sp. ZT4R22]|uniref:Glycosyltransferase family 2 protein n=1 Tax=Mucilaginibacter pankratovii TaxID=2772110 RepID=A0ABR7WVE3_9SPHI|nr:glycosyltransferase [Mucilaginibacter pankratovii]MBD1365374.1 glycosyltransferase family 2 protein [Mucilaginibacter pankratovii]